MGFLSDLATLLNAGLSVSDIKELAKINSTSQITPAPTDPSPAPAPDDPTPAPAPTDPAPSPAPDPAPDAKDDAILSEISKLTSAIQAANILNSSKKEIPQTETTDDILSANIRRMGGGANA